MGDYTRDRDLQQLYHEKQGKSVAEREAIDRTMHNIRQQGSDQSLTNLREQLVGAIRNNDSKAAKAAAERIKIYTHQKGMENNG